MKSDKIYDEKISSLNSRFFIQTFPNTNYLARTSQLFSFAEILTFFFTNFKNPIYQHKQNVLMSAFSSHGTKLLNFLNVNINAVTDLFRNCYLIETWFLNIYLASRQLEHAITFCIRS